MFLQFMKESSSYIQMESWRCEGTNASNNCLYRIGQLLTCSLWKFSTILFKLIICITYNKGNNKCNFTFCTYIDLVHHRSICWSDLIKSFVISLLTGTNSCVVSNKIIFAKLFLFCSFMYRINFRLVMADTIIFNTHIWFINNNL